MLWVPVFFFIGLLLPVIPAAADAEPEYSVDPFSCQVHYEQSQARIDRIRADFEELSESIDREIGRVRRLIIDADDPAVREKLLTGLSDLEARRTEALARALSAVGDVRVEDTQRHVSETIACPPPAYMAPDRLLAGNSFSDLFGPEVDLAGYLKIRLAGDISIDNRYENLFEAEPKVFFSIKYPVNDKLLMFVSAYGKYDYYTGGDTRHDHEIALFEAYLDVFFEKLDIRVGNQIISWGKTDVINPTDIINPLDLTNMLTGDVAEKKVPTFAIKLDYYHGNTTAELVVVPFFQEYKYDLVGSDWAIFHYGLFSEYVGGVFPWADRVDEESQKLINRSSISFSSPIQPTDSPENIQGGIRLSSKYRGWDFSLSYLNVFDRLPTVTISQGLRNAIETNTVADYFSGLSPEELAGTVSLDYRRYHMIGFDFATTVKSWGIRGEGGVFLDRYTYTDELETARDSYLFYVVGVDRLFKGDFYVNAQFIQKIIFNYDRSYIEDEFQSGVSLYTYKEFELFGRKVVPEVRALYEINGNSFFIMPKVTYKWSDTLELSLGLNIFEGDRDTIFGYFTDNDQVFFEIKYIF
ncbi:MAG: DUF1302 family protein [Deltaproteobacteria bacterium]|nr:DUF1302 family protein [Candidatus Zymogenaceae bacterium]